MSRTTTRPIPESVRTRKRYILLADACIGLSILNAAIHFTLPGVSNVAWMILGLGAAASTFALRRSIGNTDLPTAELDEYQLQQHVEAREDGLKLAIALSLVLYLITGIAAFAFQFWTEPTATDVALFFGKLAFIQLIWVPFAVTRSMAGKINRDELISAD